MPNFVRIWSVVGLEISKNYEKCMFLQVKISHFQGKIRRSRRGAGQNLMKHGWKRIFRWFRISNQIFHIIYRSRVIRRSLDLGLAVLTKNANFMDEYLENGASFWRAVFFCWSVSFSSTFWPKIIKIVEVVFEKSWKNLIFCYKIAYKKKLGFFSENPTMSVWSLYGLESLCKVSESSLEPLSRKEVSTQLTN